MKRFHPRPSWFIFSSRGHVSLFLFFFFTYCSVFLLLPIFALWVQCYGLFAYCCFVSSECVTTQAFSMVLCCGAIPQTNTADLARGCFLQFTGDVIGGPSIQQYGFNIWVEDSQLSIECYMFGFPDPVLAFPILALTSSSVPSSRDITLSRYVNLSISFRVWPLDGYHGHAFVELCFWSIYFDSKYSCS